MKKIIILVIASNDVEHERDLETQKKTWASRCPDNISVIFLRGWNNDYYFFENNTLHVPCREEYSLILTKTLLGIKYVLEHLKFDVLIRTNVSTYFEGIRLNQELNKPIYDYEFFGGYFDKTKLNHQDKKKSYEYISGAGIFMSKGAANHLVKLNPRKYLGIADDLAIFNYLITYKDIRCIRIARNNLHYTHVFIPTFYIRTKNSFDSNSSSIRMHLIDKYFTSSSLSMRIGSYLAIEKNEINEYRNHPEGIFRFLTKNRVVFWALIKAKVKFRLPLYKSAGK
jgi:hypothetical protein